MAQRTQMADWSFARRPFWLFSHLFAATVIVSFVLLGFWQLARHGERADFNDAVASRSMPPAAALADVADRADSELEYQYVEATGAFVDGEFVRVANRSQGGVAGSHLVGLFELDDGRLLLVNRGFVPLDATGIELEPAPEGTVVLTGWLQRSAEQGWLGADDSGDADLVPRLDVVAVAQRLTDGQRDAGVIRVWLQLEGDDGALLSSFPDPVPLPPLDGGPHLGYMAQWFIFATLGAAFYGALLWRTARGRQRRVPSVDPEVEVAVDLEVESH